MYPVANWVNPPYARAQSLSPTDAPPADCDDLVDGFVYNPYILKLPYRYAITAISKMDHLRRARGKYRPVWFCAPLDFRVAIAAYDTLHTQVTVIPGTWIYGLSFATLGGVANVNMMAQITDPDADMPWFSRYMYASNINSSNAAHIQPTLLTEPHCILQKGVLDIALVNRTSAAVSCQFLLVGCEPIGGLGDRPPLDQWLDTPVIRGGRPTGV